MIDSDMGNTRKNFLQRIPLQIWLMFIDAILVNIGFLVAFLIRNGFPFDAKNFVPYRNMFPLMTGIFLLSLFSFKVYKRRFKDSWKLFEKVLSGLFLGTLFNIALIYLVRTRLGGFPTSVFVIAFLVNLFLITKVNQYILKTKKRIKKQVVILGEGKVDDIVGKKANVERKHIDQISELLEYSNIDEIVVSEKITNVEDLNLLLYLEQKFKVDILFSPSVYMGLLPDRINGNDSVELLGTFVGRQTDFDEFFITVLDLSTTVTLLVLAALPMIIISILIKITSDGDVFYTQERVGKDGKMFTLYKFRTMVKDAEKMSGFEPATNCDPRVTKVGKILRRLRLDELPQLLNILQGKMSLVGPRPENLHRVHTHKALQGIRLAVKPGLTGLAQVKSAYDLHPKHKVRYDYLYIQRRSFWLNIDIMLRTIPAVFSKKGW